LVGVDIGPIERRYYSSVNAKRDHNNIVTGQKLLVLWSWAFGLRSLFFDP
jgi:hypothetical protein